MSTTIVTQLTELESKQADCKDLQDQHGDEEVADNCEHFKFDEKHDKHHSPLNNCGNTKQVFLLHFIILMDPESAKIAQEKQAQLALKKQIVCADNVLKDFNWTLSMPLDQSQVVKSGSAIINHS